MEAGRSAFVRSGMVLSCVKPGSGEPSNKGMKQTKPGFALSFAAYPSVGQTIRVLDGGVNA